VMAGTMAVRFVWAAGATQAEHLTQTTAAIVVWLGAVSAMVTKGALAVTLGAGVRRRIADRVSPRVVRYVAVAALLVLGTLSVLETLGIMPG